MNKENQQPEPERAESDVEYEDDPFEELYPPKKVDQWDCDTILSMFLAVDCQCTANILFACRYILKLREPSKTDSGAFKQNQTLQKDRDATGRSSW